jgi:hypothetical protein
MNLELGVKLTCLDGSTDALALSGASRSLSQTFGAIIFCRFTSDARAFRESPLGNDERTIGWLA